LRQWTAHSILTGGARWQSATFPFLSLPQFSSPPSLRHEVAPLETGVQGFLPGIKKNLYGCRRDLVQVFSKTRTYKTNKNSAEISFVWVLFTSSMM